tara:strand:- start:2499 stop:2621 length:123 start_codon:yes stop_codon:yes gene_type:complete
MGSIKVEKVLNKIEKALLQDGIRLFSREESEHTDDSSNNK